MYTATLIFRPLTTFLGFKIVHVLCIIASLCSLLSVGVWCHDTTVNLFKLYPCLVELEKWGQPTNQQGN